MKFFAKPLSNADTVFNIQPCFSIGSVGSTTTGISLDFSTKSFCVDFFKLACSAAVISLDKASELGAYNCPFLSNIKPFSSFVL